MLSFLSQKESHRIVFYLILIVSQAFFFFLSLSLFPSLIVVNRSVTDEQTL